MDDAIRTVRHRSPDGAWEMVHGEVPPAFRGAVRRWIGYTAAGPAVAPHRELPSCEIPLIVSFGAPYRVSRAGDADARAPRLGFVAGIHDTYAVTAGTGEAACMQVNLTPSGARRLLGRPLSEMGNLVVGVDELFGAEPERLADRLHASASWEERFRWMRGFLAARLAASPGRRTVAEEAWNRLVAAEGRIEVGALAASLGCSRKYLASAFADEVGTTPKVAARILRFQRALRCMDGGMGWTETALASGYYDQAHLIRDVRRMAGMTPGELLRARRETAPEAGGAVAA